MTEEAKEQEHEISDEICEQVVDHVIRVIDNSSGDGYDQFRTVDLLFERIIAIYKYYNFKPEEVIEAVYDVYDITKQ